MMYSFTFSPKRKHWGKESRIYMMKGGEGSNWRQGRSIQEEKWWVTGKLLDNNIQGIILYLPQVMPNTYMYAYMYKYIHIYSFKLYKVIHIIFIIINQAQETSFWVIDWSGKNKCLPTQCRLSLLALVDLGCWRWAPVAEDITFLHVQESGFKGLCKPEDNKSKFSMPAPYSRSWWIRK